MEKNIAALLREDTKTIGVRFFKDSREVNPTLLGDDNSLSPKIYRYVTTLDLMVGDLVIVLVANIPKIVLVVIVDDDCVIDPQDTVEYKWVVSKVDMTEYNLNMDKNRAILDTVSAAYKKNLREQFQSILMKNLGRSDKLKLKNILKS